MSPGMNTVGAESLNICWYLQNFAIVLLQYQYLDISSIYIIRCTQSTFQHSWLEHLLLLKMHVHCVSCLPWYLGICVRRMIHDWNWSKSYPESWALKKDPSITMLPNFRWLSSLHVSSKMEERGASKGATGSMINDVLPPRLIFTTWHQTIITYGFKISSSFCPVEDL